MKEHPILFNGEMVRAILEGRKTQTRRIINFPWINEIIRVHSYVDGSFDFIFPGGKGFIQKPPYKNGDHLWVRETWQLVYALNGDDYIYRATDKCSGKWRPSIFMPKEASRITLEVTDVRVQRIQEICLDDIRAEGLGPLEICIPADCNEPHPDAVNLAYRTCWQLLWDSIYAKRGFGWNVNPWVWAYTFKLLEVKK